MSRSTGYRRADLRECSVDCARLVASNLHRSSNMNRAVTRIGLLALALAFTAAATMGCSSNGGGSPGVGGKGGAVGSAGTGASGGSGGGGTTGRGGSSGGGGSGGTGGVSGSGGVPGRACNFSMFGSGRTVNSQTDATTIVVRQSSGALTSINDVPCASTSVLPYYGMMCGETYACGDCTFTIIRDEPGFWNFNMSETERAKPACAGFAASYLFNYVPTTTDCAADASAACSSCIAACSGQVDCCCTAGAHCSCRSDCTP
jgi:hypothetical protein